MRLNRTVGPLIFLILFNLILTLVRGASLQPNHHQLHRRKHISENLHVQRAPFPRDNQPSQPPRLQNATQADIDKAREVVRDAIAQASVRNKHRLMNPIRNNYGLAPNTHINRRQNGDAQGSFNATQPLNLTRSGSIPGINAPGPPLFNVTSEIAEAAALVAEADAYSVHIENATTIPQNSSHSSGVLHIDAASSPASWMYSIDRKGSWPWASDQDYQVFRNVKSFGAAGDGKTDDTLAITAAINAGRRCGAGCNGSTLKNAIVYFPPGNYLVSGSIQVIFGTQLVGDPLSKPTITAAASFVGLGVLSTDFYVENGGDGVDGNAKEWYINTSNFYRQIRNFIIDITRTDQTASVCGIHYQVAQATSLQNVTIIATTSSTTTQQGIFAENGSGGQMADVTLVGGAYGIWGGEQQFTAQRLLFVDCQTAVYLDWDWGFTWKNIEVYNSKYGFQLVSSDGKSAIGSIYLIDSQFYNVPTAIQIMPASEYLGTRTTGITLDNVAFSGVSSAVADTNGKVYLAGGAAVDTWVLGPLYFDAARKGVSLGFSYDTPRDNTLTTGSPADGFPKASFYERAKPQYENLGVGNFVHMKNYATGDGSTDDTAKFQQALDENNDGTKVIFVDAGTYILTDTVTIPSGVRMVGEGWSQIAAYGPKFGDAENPRPMLKIGNSGDIGTVELQDLLFTTKGPTPGAILVEWNLKASNQGSAGMWDCHARVGGATGTELTPAQCPPSTTGTDGLQCQGGSLMLHLTRGSSAYIENSWLWVADHQIDDPDWTNDNNDMTQVSIYNARGVLIESQDPTWLYGTSSEHSVFYQYNFNNAKSVFAGMIQTESPYYQPNPKPPFPFEAAVGKVSGDPTYNCPAGSSGTAGCDESWAVIIRGSQNVQIAGAGLYSWFQNYSQTCVDGIECQNTLMLLEDNYQAVRLHNLITIGAEYMLIADGTKVEAGLNLAVLFHPYWSQLTVFDPIQNTPDPCKGRPTNPTGHAVPSGNIYSGYQGDAGQWIDDASIQYVTIVNGSPFTFKVTGQHDYQMDNFTFADIQPGRSLQNVMQYGAGGSGSIVDDKGEVYYALDGTDYTFQIWARTDIGGDNPAVNPERIDYDYAQLPSYGVSEGSTVELYSPGSERARNFVLTGDPHIGFFSSVNPPTAWMSKILPVIGDRKLKHICMPGSHDAGMSEKNGGTALIDFDLNVRTQRFGIGDQLRLGSRFFDIRPVQGLGGAYLTGHYSDSSPELGANGQYLNDIVNEINEFTVDNPELIILYLSHSMNTDAHVGSNEVSKYPSFNETQWSNTYNILQELTHRCPGLDANDLTEMTMNDFIGKGQACVLVIVSGDTGRPDQGFYPLDRFPSDTDHWSNTDSISHMMSDQLAYVNSHRNLVQSDESRMDTFLVTQWILTLLSIDNIEFSIEDLALRFAYDPLYWGFYDWLTPWSYPNVFLLDFIGEAAIGDGNFDEASTEIIALAMAINLQIASQNCYVGGGSLSP